MATVDVAINVYGKPYQTAVTLLSLLKHSGQHLNKIYFVVEPEQPRKESFEFLLDALGDQVVRYTPQHWLWVEPTKTASYGDDE